MKTRKTTSLIKHIISGGQSGVDRAALDFSIKHHIPCGGWCPKGRIAEDGVIDQKYPLKETQQSDPKERTHKNIDWADATLIIIDKLIDQGTKETIQYANQQNKNFFAFYLNKENDLSYLEDWFKNSEISILNIAGPRESNSKGIYKKTLAFLEDIYHLM